MIPSAGPAIGRAAFSLYPPDAVRPAGWLREQLRRSASGLTGRLMDIWPDVGPTSGWLGGPGENWERGPYYLRGLVALAHALGDAELAAQTRPWIEWTLRSQRDDGFFGPTDNDDWWPRMPMLEALRWHHAATGDPRVVPFMLRYFHHQAAALPHRPLDGWARPRGGDTIDHVLWAYGRTGELFLLELADRVHAQTSDWIGEFAGEGPPSEGFEFGHGVNRAMGFKTPAVYFQRSRDPAHWAALRTGWERTMRYHGQVQGLYSGDEFLHGRGPTQGVEFCSIVELLSSFETALRIGGELWLAAAIERMAYNALPAILNPEHTAHQYFQLANQVECTPGGRNFHVHHDTDLLFGPATGYGCCAANYHMGWPRFAAHVWLRSPTDTPVAMFFAPSELDHHLADGRRVTIVEDTAYPFDEDVRFVIQAPVPVTFPLTVRVPSWAPAAVLSLNGATIPGSHAGGTLATVSRTWSDGDQLVVHVPMRPVVTPQDGGAVAVERGPLVYALRIGEEWRKVGGTEPFADYEVHPTTPWNYALALDPRDPGAAFTAVRRPLATQPWAQDGASVQLHARARRIPRWHVENGVSGPLPRSPVAADTPLETVTLVPFGCARLRISVFPVTGHA